MNAAIYCRISSEKQEGNWSLGTQEEACRRCAADRGYAVAGVYTEIYTGSNLWDRPRLNEVRDLVRRGEVAIVIAYAIDRLSRDAAHLHILIDEAERHGVAIAFATESLDSSPIGKVMLSLRGFAAEVEREKIIERTRRGLRARAAAGKLRASRPLFGYRWPIEVIDGEATTIRDRYEVDPATAPMVVRISRDYVGGVSLLALTTRLNDAAIPSPTGRGWNRKTVWKMLKNPGYKGEAWAGRQGSVKERGRTRQVKLPPEEWTRLPDGTIPPLVDAAIWGECQERARRNVAESTRHNADPEGFLLRGGYVRCAHCGGAAHAGRRAARNGKRENIYRVSSNGAQHVGCPLISIKAADLDAAAEVYLRRVVLDREVLQVMIQRLRDKDTTARDAAGVEASLAGIKRRQTIVANAVASLDDPDAAAPLLEKLNGLAQERRTMEAELEGLRTRADAASATLAALDNLQDRVDTLRENWPSLPYAAKRDLLAALDLRVTLRGKDAEDRYTIESDADGLLQAIALPSHG
jgi:site-specific DNA recombinase